MGSAEVPQNWSEKIAALRAEAEALAASEDKKKRADVQLRLGHALWELAQQLEGREGDRAAGEASDAFHEAAALLESCREQGSEEWVDAKYHEGLACVRCGAYDPGIWALNALLGENLPKDRHRLARVWFTSGVALRAVPGFLGSDEDSAVGCFFQALDLFDPQTEREEWLECHSQFAFAMLDLGYQNYNLRDAIESLRLVLEGRSWEGHEEDWAEAMLYLGRAYLHLVEDDGEKEDAEEAIKAFRQVLERFPLSEDSWCAREATMSMGRVQLELAGWTKDPEVALQAVQILEDYARWCESFGRRRRQEAMEARSLAQQARVLLERLGREGGESEP